MAVAKTDAALLAAIRRHSKAYRAAKIEKDATDRRQCELNTIMNEAERELSTLIRELHGALSLPTFEGYGYNR